MLLHAFTSMSISSLCEFPDYELLKIENFNQSESITGPSSPVEYQMFRTIQAIFIPNLVQWFLSEEDWNVNKLQMTYDNSCKVIYYVTLLYYRVFRNHMCDEFGRNVHFIIYFYHILVDDKAKILPCNKTLSFVSNSWIHRVCKHSFPEIHKVNLWTLT
jgi:hypothetical protein